MVFAAGTGNPYFTTDTTAALRAAEIGAQAILKGTHSGVDGVYSADPRLDPAAVKLTEVSHFEILNKGLKVMDSTAITFCMDNELPIVVFDVTAPGNIRRALLGERIGTLVESRGWRHEWRRRRDEGAGPRRLRRQDAEGGRAPAVGVRRGAHRAGVAGTGREAAGRGLRQRRPAAADRRLRRARTARAHDLALRQGHDQGHREGDPAERPRRQPVERRRRSSA